MILVGVSESDSEVDSLNRGRLAGVVVSASRGVGDSSRMGLGMAVGGVTCIDELLSI